MLPKRPLRPPVWVNVCVKSWRGGVLRVERAACTEAPAHFLARRCRRALADDDRHVRETLALEGGAPLRARIDALGETAAGAAVHGNARNVEIVHVHVVVIAGVGDRAAEQLLDRIGGIDVGELEQHERLAHALAANCVGDATKFARSGADEAQMRGGLSGSFH